MPLSFFDFLSQLSGNPALTVAVILTLAVMLVNGWTDAPNAIAGAVVTGAIPFSGAVVMAAVCNLLGVLCVTAVNTSVAETVYSIASFNGGSRSALAALCAAMTAIVLWATAAWVFGIPTSESHALVAGISGAAVALEGGFSCIHWGSWLKVLLGLVLSTGAGFWSGKQVEKWMEKLNWSENKFRRAQIPGAAITAFFHGAQDGQKFLGVFLLGVALSSGRQDEQTFVIPLWLLVLCALTMAGGTAMGGRRIIDTVGREMVSIGPREGFSSDVAGGGCLLIATLFGLPVSTTHTKTAAMLGVGTAGGRGVDWGVAGKIGLAWVLTFPGCMAVGYWTARLFLVFS